MSGPQPPRVQCATLGSMALPLNGRHQGPAPYTYEIFVDLNLLFVPITLKYGLAMFKGNGVTECSVSGVPA